MASKEPSTTTRGETKSSLMWRLVGMSAQSSTFFIVLGLNVKLCTLRSGCWLLSSRRLCSSSRSRQL